MEVYILIAIGLCVVTQLFFVLKLISKVLKYVRFIGETNRNLQMIESSLEGLRSKNDKQLRSIDDGLTILVRDWRDGSSIEATLKSIELSLTKLGGDFNGIKKININDPDSKVNIIRSNKKVKELEKIKEIQEVKEPSSSTLVVTTDQVVVSTSETE